MKMLVLVLLFLASCVKPKTEKPPQPQEINGFITSAQISAWQETLKPVDQDIVLEWLNSTYRLNDKLQHLYEIDNRCLSKMTAVKPEIDTITISGEKRNVECSQIIDTTRVDNKHKHFQIYHITKCPGIDLSFLLGASVDHARYTADTYCAQSAHKYDYLNLRYTSIHQFDVPPIETLEVAETHNEVLFGRNISEPCYSTKQKHGMMKTECTWILKKNIDDVSYFQAMEYHDVLGVGGRWYESGTIKYKYNNWAGEIVFRGSNIPPTYTLTNNETESTGVLDP